jgi:hypothetical protein
MAEAGCYDSKPDCFGDEARFIFRFLLKSMLVWDRAQSWQRLAEEALACKMDRRTLNSTPTVMP